MYNKGNNEIGMQRRNFMELKKAIATRQSCRSYTGEQITDDQLKMILEAANASPISMGKYEEVHLTVIQNKDLLAKLDNVGAKYFKNPEMRPTYGAPTVILVSGIIPKNQKNPTSYCNAGCIIENMALTATDLGIGHVYILGTAIALGFEPELCIECKIPEGFTPISALALGKTTMVFTEREMTMSNIATEYIK